MVRRIPIKHVVLPAILLAGVSANMVLGQAMSKAQVVNLIKKVEEGAPHTRSRLDCILGLALWSVPK